MHHLLDSVHWKIERAEAHIKTIKAEMRTHFDAHQYFAVPEFSVDKTEMIVYLHGDEPSHVFSMIAGDCLQNIRASLDHLVCALVERDNGVVKKQAFPICHSATDFRNVLAKGRMLAGIKDKPAIDLISTLQPYHGGNLSSHPLCILRELSNADKHRAVAVTTIYATIESFALVIYGKTIPFRPVTHPVQSQGEIFRFRAPSGLTDMNVQVQVKGEAKVAFKEPPVAGQYVSDVLNSVVEYVKSRVIPAFEPLF